MISRAWRFSDRRIEKKQCSVEKNCMNKMVPLKGGVVLLCHVERNCCKNIIGTSAQLSKLSTETCYCCYSFPELKICNFVEKNLHYPILKAQLDNQR